MNQPAIDLDTLPELNFARYAPAKRHDLVVVRSRPPAPKKPRQPPGELAVLGQSIGGALGLIWQCVQLALLIVWRRVVLRIQTVYHRIAQSLSIAWALAGFGWGGFVAFPIILYLVR